VTSLEASYAYCRELTKAHGTTYYWSTRLLPAERQRHVFALYGLCRWADDLVDNTEAQNSTVRAALLDVLQNRLSSDLDVGRSDHEVLAAVVDTTHRFGIDPHCYRRFLRSMSMDLTVTSYETFADLIDYMDGSAAVIGEMMMPILGTDDPVAVEPARCLGVAFQLTNFLRDVGEDLDRGRVYIPREDIERFDADPWSRQVTPKWVALMRYEIERTRAYYTRADAGIALLPSRSARAIRSARVLYSTILSRIEANGYDVFSRRARLSTARKIGTAARSLLVPLPEPSPTPAGRYVAGTIGTRNP
jgi:phytoene synthase